MSQYASLELPLLGNLCGIIKCGKRNERDMAINACRLGRGGYIKTQLFLYHSYYADDDMFRPLWVTKMCNEENYTVNDH